MTIAQTLLEEQERVIRAGAVVNNLYLPPIDGPTTEQLGNGSVDLIVLIDLPIEQIGRNTQQPELSPEQLAAGVKWKQPETSWVDAKALEGEDLAQRIADCSLHASVVVALAHSRRFNTDRSIPQLCARNGGYDLVVDFNGCRRRVCRVPSHLLQVRVLMRSSYVCTLSV